MIGPLLSADNAGNVLIEGTMTSAADRAYVEHLGGDVVRLSIGCDEAVELRIVATIEVLELVLRTALAEMERTDHDDDE